MRIVQSANLHLVDVHMRELFCCFNLLASYASSFFEWLQNSSGQNPATSRVVKLHSDLTLASSGNTFKCHLGVYDVKAPAFNILNRTNLEVPVYALVWAKMAAVLVSKVHPVLESRRRIMQ